MKKIIMLAVMAICAVQTQAAMTDYLQYNMADCYYRGKTIRYSVAYASNEDALSYYSYYSLSTDSLRKLAGGALTKLEGVNTATLAYGESLPNTRPLDQVIAWAAANYETLYTQLSTGQGLPDGVSYTKWVNTQTLTSTTPSLLQLYNENVTKDSLKAQTTEEIANESAIEETRWVLSFYKDADEQYNGAIRVTLLGYKGKVHNSDYTTLLADDGMVTKNSAYPMDWVAAAIPEPTSGLLLLLGVAGLALKRKRA